MKRSRKHIHQMTVGLRTQLCKECHDFQRRLCEVNGRPATFHRWIDEDQAVLKINSFNTREVYDSIAQKFKLEQVCGPDNDVVMARKTYALVEYDDGTVGKVDPTSIKFTDRGGPGA